MNENPQHPSQGWPTTIEPTTVEPGTVEPGRWEKMVAANPDHPRNYAERFRQMAAQGADLVGEARFIDAMAPRGARILDAGCGPGRHAGYLAERGHSVVGVDLDPTLIEIARTESPGPTYLVGDLTELDLPARGITEGFELILCAGNVITFPAESSRHRILTSLGNHLSPGGRLVVGFGAGRGYDFADFLTDAAQAGLLLQLGLGSWDMRPFTEESDFLVAIFVKA